LGGEEDEYWCKVCGKLHDGGEYILEGSLTRVLIVWEMARLVDEGKKGD
jgi:hypothetical protein